MNQQGIVGIGGAIAVATLCALALILVPRLVCFWNRRPAQGGWYNALQCAGWTLLLIVFLGQSFTFGLGLINFGMLAGAGLILIMLVEQQRRAQRAFLLQMISIALTRRLPLSPVLATFGRDAVGWTSDLGEKMAVALDQGMPLDEALDRAGDPLGDAAGVLVRVGRETDNLDQALMKLAAIEKHSGPLWRALAGRVFYIAMVTLCIMSVVTFGMLYIVPSMEKIFWEFNLDLPLMTQLVIWVSHKFFTYGGFVAGPLLAIAIPVLFLYACWRFVGHSRRDLSLIGRLGMPLHRACILDALSLAADKGRPLEGVTSLLAAIYPRGFVRRRLAWAHILMGQGRDWLDSLREASLLRANDVAALRLAREQNHLVWCLSELATASRRRYLQRAQALGQMALPFVLLAVGLAVAMIAIAMFMPLVALINSLI